MDSNKTGNKSNVIPIETVQGVSASNKKSKRDPISSILGKRPSGKQLRETLQEALPMEKAKRAETKIGRPTKYNDQIASDVLGLMADGYSLTEAADKLKINRSTIYRFAEANPSFAAALARGRQALAEHSFTMAASVPRALYARVQAGEPIDGPTVAAARLYTDSLKWYAERLHPAAFAPQSKASVEVSGTLAVASVLIDSRSLSPDARDALRYALQAANAAPVIEHDEGEGVDE
jgi:hypothetical protein